MGECSVVALGKASGINNDEQTSETQLITGESKSQKKTKANNYEDSETRCKGWSTKNNDDEVTLSLIEY